MDDKGKTGLEKAAAGWSKVGSCLAKLINVKSLVTLVMTVALVALLFTGIDPSKELLALYCTSYGAVITYFFNHKSKEG